MRLSTLHHRALSGGLARRASLSRESTRQSLAGPSAALPSHAGLARHAPPIFRAVSTTSTADADADGASPCFAGTYIGDRAKIPARLPSSDAMFVAPPIERWSAAPEEGPSESEIRSARMAKAERESFFSHKHLGARRGARRQRTPWIRTDPWVAPETSRRDASPGPFNSAQTFGVRCRHAPKVVCRKGCARAEAIRQAGLEPYEYTYPG